MLKISVIIPVYNVEKYLPECLDSIIKQTFKDIEIICIDDGSTDGSLNILNEYASKDARFIILNQGNQGVSAARNNGLDIATGKYVAFIDSDDYLISNDYFENLYNACEKYNADISVASIIRGNEKKSEYILKIEKEEVATDYVEKLNLCALPDLNHVWNKLYKRKSLINSGVKFPEGMIYEDVCVTHKYLYYMTKLVSVPDIVYFYRKLNGSLITVNSTKTKCDFKKAEASMFKFFLDKNIDINLLESRTKKYKLFGITFFKTITRNKKRKNILFNSIKWDSFLVGD